MKNAITAKEAKAITADNIFDYGAVHRFLEKIFAYITIKASGGNSDVILLDSFFLRDECLSSEEYKTVKEKLEYLGYEIHDFRSETHDNIPYGGMMISW